MSPSRKGKIARLPLEIREILNRHIQNGQSGKSLVKWLNSRREVKLVIFAEFGGRPISEQNLTDWKQGGYRDWLALQEARDVITLLEEGTVNNDPDGQGLSNIITNWLLVRCAVASRRLLETKGPEHWRLLRELCSHVAELRRIINDTERLNMERERLSMERVRASTEDYYRQQKYRNNIEIGMDSLLCYVKQFPEALDAYRSLMLHVQKNTAFSLTPDEKEDLKKLESERIRTSPAQT